MTFEEELWMALSQAWRDGEADSFHWKGYDCQLVPNGYSVSGIGVLFSTVDLRLDGPDFAYRWEVEPSPDQLMKLRLLV